MTAKAVAAVLVAITVTLVSVLLSLGAAGVLSLVGGSVRWSVEPVVLTQLAALQVINVLVGAGFGLLLQSTAVGVIAYFVVPFAAGLTMLSPPLRELAPWIDLADATEALSLDLVATPQEWLQALTVTVVWAGVPLVLGWLRLRRREIV